MGKPVDAEFERSIRKKVHERYKEMAAANRELYEQLRKARASIEVLEYRLAEQADIVSLANEIISEGAMNDDACQSTPAGREDSDD